MSCGRPCASSLAIVRVPARRWRTRADLVGQLDEARQRIEDEPASDLKLDDLADSATMSKHHFARLFRDTFGYTPHRYLALRRIGLAKEMLQQTKRSVSDIALNVGYATPAAFTREFRKATGLAPRVFRAKSATLE